MPENLSIIRLVRLSVYLWFQCFLFNIICQRTRRAKWINPCDIPPNQSLWFSQCFQMRIESEHTMVKVQHLLVFTHNDCICSTQVYLYSLRLHVRYVSKTLVLQLLSYMKHSLKCSPKMLTAVTWITMYLFDAIIDLI